MDENGNMKNLNNINNNVSSVQHVNSNLQSNSIGEKLSNLSNNRELNTAAELSNHEKTGPRYSDFSSGLSSGDDNSSSTSNNAAKLPKNNLNTSNNRLKNKQNSPLKGFNKNNIKPNSNFKNAKNLKKAAANNLLKNKSKSNSNNNSLGNALSSKKAFSPRKAASNFLKRAFLPSSMNNTSLLNSKDKLEEQNQNEGLTNLKIPKKAIITATIILIPCFSLLLFFVVVIAASQTFLNAVTLGHADDISDEKALEKIEKIQNSEEKLNVEINDVSYINDIYIEETNKKFDHYEFAAKKSNVIDSEELSTNKEASLDDLKEFYPDIVNYTGDEYNQNDVYKFYVKLYNVYNYYYGMGVKLDMPLLMSVLNLQSTDMSEVFKANTVDYDNTAIDKGFDNPDFDIKKDWSNYKSTRNNSSHDIEVLAQGMVREGRSGSSSNYVGDLEFMTGGIGDIYYFNQLDYADKPYGSYGTIASHGCGPTSLSIVVSSLLKEVHDPIELTNYVCSIGGCFNEGSSWDSITQTPPHYGLKVNMTTNTQEVISALGTGKSLAIAIMCPGHFTTGGHFIVLTGTNTKGEVTIADPASRDRSTNWDFNIVASENCGAYWVISK